MGPWWAAFMVMLAPMAYRVTSAIGLGFVTYKGVTLLTGQVGSFIETKFSNLPPQLYQLAALMEIDTAVDLILSAVAVRALLAGWDAMGEKRHPVWRKPGSDWEA